MVSVLVPLCYLVALFGSLAVFSKYYRKKQLESKAPKTAWFPQHKARDLYVSILSLEPPPPKHVLVAALLQRAMEDVRRIWVIRDSKQALQTLLTKGQIGDDLWENFVLAEKELEAEIVEVVGEANYFQEGYGQNIFALASEMVTHQKWKDVYGDINKEREKAKARYTSSTPPSLVLSPFSHLTPSSLTLFPSNPLSLDAPPPSSPQITLAPPPALPSTPPSPSLPPATPVKASSTGSGANTPSASSSKSTVQSAATPATPATPASAKKTPTKGKGKKKPPVKGGK